jgi:hypothetical protein
MRNGAEREPGANVKIKEGRKKKTRGGPAVGTSLSGPAAR